MSRWIYNVSGSQGRADSSSKRGAFAGNRKESIFFVSCTLFKPTWWAVFSRLEGRGDGLGQSRAFSGLSGAMQSSAVTSSLPADSQNYN